MNIKSSPRPIPVRLANVPVDSGNIDIIMIMIQMALHTRSMPKDIFPSLNLNVVYIMPIIPINTPMY